MKTILSATMLFISSFSFSQDVYPTPQFCFSVFTPPSVTFNFHRPRKDCKSGFSICFRINPGQYGFVRCEKAREQEENVSLENNLVSYMIYLQDNKAYFHFPAALRYASGFTEEDMRYFFIDSEDFVLGDEEQRVAFRCKPGAYPVDERDGRLIAAVDTEPADIRSLK